MKDKYYTIQLVAYSEDCVVKAKSREEAIEITHSDFSLEDLGINDVQVNVLSVSDKPEEEDEEVE